MLGRIKHYASVGAILLRQSIQAWMEYPVSLMGWLLANPIQFLVGFATIRFVVEQFETLQGWGYEQLAFLYGLSVLSHGLSIVLFIQTWYLGYLVINGEFDRFLLRPLNVLFQYLFMDFNLIGFTDLIPGIIIFVYGCIRVQFEWNLKNIVLMAAVLTGGTLLRGAIWLILGAVSFWSKNRGGFVTFTLQLYDRTTMYPLTMYPRFIQAIFTFILPLGWITFYPAGAFLNKDTLYLPVSAHMVTLLVGTASFMLACFVFTRGLKRYESSGT